MTSSNFILAKSLGKAVAIDNISSSGEIASTTAVYATSDLLPGDAEPGDTAWVTSRGAEYIFSGEGWYVIKAAPPSFDFSISNHQQCHDHAAGLSHDGNGNLRISSHSPGTIGYGNIHTGRSDCSAQQGLINIYTFSSASYNLEDYTSVSGTLTYSGRNGSGSYNFSYDDITSGTASSISNVGFTDTSGGAGTYTFSISGTFS